MKSCPHLRAPRGPAGAWARRATAPRRPGRARACPSRWPPPCFRRGTGPAPCSRPRPAPRARAGARRTRGSGASRRPPGRWRRSRPSPATCSRSSRGRRAAGSAGPRRRTRRTFRPLRVSRSIWVTVSTRSVAVEPSGSSPVSLKPTTCGSSIDTGLAEHRGLGLDPANAPAQHAEAVDHRRVRVGADQRVRERLAVARLDNAREVLEVHLVADAGVGRHHAEVVERRLAPAQERVALAVARRTRARRCAGRRAARRTRRPGSSGRSRARPAPAD